MNEEDTASFQDAASALHRLRWIAVFVLACFVVVAVIAGAFVIGTQHAQLSRDEKRQQASCSFYAVIGNAPVVPAPNTKKVSRLGVTLVVDARNAFLGQSCPGTALQPPSATLRHWVVFYNLDLRG